MKKIAKVLLSVLFSLVCMLGLACCDVGEQANGKLSASVEKAEGFVAITVIEVEGEATLFDVMEQCKQNGELSYTFDGTGMLMQLEGVQNAYDWSACWMLYLNDPELADQSYTKEWKNEEYGSSPVGATQLPVSVGCTYLWSYDQF